MGREENEKCNWGESSKLICFLLKRAGPLGRRRIFRQHKQISSLRKGCPSSSWLHTSCRLIRARCRHRKGQNS